MANGYEVVARNWRCRDGELDLVVAVRALDDEVPVSPPGDTWTVFGAPVEAVTRAKQVRLRHLAARWLRDHAGMRASEIRFDVASVLGGQVEIVQGAF